MPTCGAHTIGDIRGPGGLRLAWFSPMPPVRSGIASCSAELVAALGEEHEIDVFVDEPLVSRGDNPGGHLLRSAHDFVWLHAQRPYDLTVYQLGNSSHHDYLWPYLFRYPGLTVLHDAHLHHARAAALLRARRAEEYRVEFAANHPDTNPDAAELAVAGFDNHLYYTWPMTRLVVEVSRVTAVHGQQIAAELRADVPGAAVEAVRLGHGAEVPPPRAAEARERVRARYLVPAGAILFGCFGGLTPDKRIPQVLDAFQALLPYWPGARLMLAGAPAAHYDVAADVARRGLGARVTLTGYLEQDDELTDCIAACDVTLNLRWPTARELSGPWLRCLAAAKPTIVIDLAHLTAFPSLDPRTWTVNVPSAEPKLPEANDPVTVAIDIVDEDHSLRLAMRRLASDAALRASLGRAGHAWWTREHSFGPMLEDYRRVIAMAQARPAPCVDLPRHLVDAGDRVLREVTEGFGIPSPLTTYDP
jgi:glycosyltransferase involved in cell wall biosynthesis